MAARFGIDELACDAHAVCCSAHAALEHVANAKVAANLRHTDGAALVGEARIAGDHEEPPYMRKRSDDVLDHAVGEVILLRITAHVHKRQHGYRGLVR